MNLKQLINKAVYGTIGYIASQEDIKLLESYILYNLPILKEFKQIIVATNYGDLNSELISENTNLWKKYFPNCYLLDSQLNRGHSFGTADLDNLIFDYCKESNIEWLCKSANDVILNENIFDIEITQADFYYLNGISYEDLYLNNFDYGKLFKSHFFPQTNFYFLNISKCDYLNNKDYLNDTFKYIGKIPNYSGKVWEYVKDWSCENFLKSCATRNNLQTQYLLNKEMHSRLCEVIKISKIGDPSHKNLIIEGICHFQYPNLPVIKI